MQNHENVFHRYRYVSFMAIFILAVFTSLSRAESTLIVDVADLGHPINDTQYGIFYEEISHGGDGGLYAELIKNRSFEDSLTDIPEWSFYNVEPAHGYMSLDAKNQLNDAQARALKINIISDGGTVGITNSGHWGINIRKNREYTLTFFARAEMETGSKLTAKLQSRDKKQTFAAHTFSTLSAGWKKYTATLKAEGSATDGVFTLEIATPDQGMLWLDVVSLFPPTWRGQPNGLRSDIAEMIADLTPAFIRFPGGSYTSTYPDRAPEWLNEIGPIEQRPGHPAPGIKCPWGYHCTAGFGFHEYLVWAEQLGAEPIYVFQGGADPLAQQRRGKTYIEGAELEQLIEEILAGIEYANGDVTTPWGAKRAANGHPAPFNMRYIQIGNENWHKPFHDNYVKIYNAVKACYPYIQVIWGGDWIGNNQHSYDSDGIMPEGSSAEIVDEHFYKSDDWFYENADRYSPENYPRNVQNEVKIFIGEASAKSDTLGGALKEAAFLVSSEKYSDKVVMAVYAPLLCNVNFKKWGANAIYFDNHRVYGTPSYYVQRMLSNHVGEVNIGVSGLDDLMKQSLFVNANLVKKNGEVIIKIVNRDDTVYPIRIALRNAGPEAFETREILLTADSKKAGNSFKNPRNVAPIVSDLGTTSPSFDYTVNANSFTLLRLKPQKPTH